MEEVRWDIPFDPQDVGKIPMFVWCKSIDEAREFCTQYCNDVNGHEWWIDRWYSYQEETIYAIPSQNSSDKFWMYGTRDSLTRCAWDTKGYVPRAFQPITHVEVEDLI